MSSFTFDWSIANIALNQVSGSDDIESEVQNTGGSDDVASEADNKDSSGDRVREVLSQDIVENSEHEIEQVKELIEQVQCYF